MRAALALLLAGCATGATTDLDADSGPVGEHSVALGYYPTDDFVPLEGGTLKIINGFQGGTWAMPGLRIVGFTGLCAIDASVTVRQTGEAVGSISGAREQLDPRDGVADVYTMPIPIAHPGSARPIDDLDGLAAWVDLKVADEALTEATTRVNVTLARSAP